MSARSAASPAGGPDRATRRLRAWPTAPWADADVADVRAPVPTLRVGRASSDAIARDQVEGRVAAAPADAPSGSAGPATRRRCRRRALRPSREPPTALASGPPRWRRGGASSAPSASRSRTPGADRPSRSQGEHGVGAWGEQPTALGAGRAPLGRPRRRGRRSAGGRNVDPGRGRSALRVAPKPNHADRRSTRASGAIAHVSACRASPALTFTSAAGRDAAAVARRARLAAASAPPPRSR